MLWVVVLQNLNELQLERFSYGGATMTGFRLVSSLPSPMHGRSREEEEEREKEEDWKRISHSQSSSGTRGELKVRSCTQQMYSTSLDSELFMYVKYTVFINYCYKQNGNKHQTSVSFYAL